MGDVFDAMKKARARSAADATPPPAAPSESPAFSSDSATPSPPAPLSARPEDRSASTEPLPLSPVATAVERARRLLSSAQQTVATLLTPPPGLSDGFSPQIVVHHDRGGLITEQYRAIRTQILARCKNRRLQIHLVTSAAPEEGKTVTTINLALAFAELRNQRILLLEADLRRPRFRTYLPGSSEPGLIHYLRGDIDQLDPLLHPSGYENCHILPAGGIESLHSTQLLSSARLAQLLDRLRDRYDFIFIDSPPVITVTDPCILGALADQTILVVRLNHTPAEVVERARRLLRAANCEVAGVVLTHLEPDVSHYIYRESYYTRYYTQKR